MMHNFKYTESWEDKASNKLNDRQLASPSLL